MIPIERLNAVTTIVTHAECSDGIASAIILYAALHVPVVEVRPDSDEYTNLQPVPGMLFCDIAPPTDRVDQFIAAGAIVLDHHESARALVARFGENGVFGETKDGVSGAVLAYREVWARILPSPLYVGEDDDFLDYLSGIIGVRDTWQKDSDSWEEAVLVSNLLRSISLPVWLSHTPEDLYRNWDNFLFIQKQSTKRQEAANKDWAMSKATIVPLLNGLRVALVNTVEVSDVSDLIITAEVADIVVGYEFRRWQDWPCMKLSLRSSSAFDCNVFASRFEGGGGHPRAAGLTFPIISSDPNPYTLIRRMLNGEVGARSFADLTGGARE